MDETSIITVLTALVAALGAKEIWNIWKKKIDNSHELELKEQRSKDKLTSQVIEELKVKIGELEEKIDDLIEKNKQCAIKLARLEERMTLSAKKNSNRKRTKSSNGTKK
jgi:regulator of replication initiation timing